MARFALFLSFALLTCMTALTAYAESSVPATEQTTAELPNDTALIAMREAWQAVENDKIVGPAKTTLLGKANLNIPENYWFVSARAARQYLESLGNTQDNSVEGLFIPADENANWLVVISYDDSGYIKDEEAKDWDVDGMLESIKEGTAQANQVRIASGFPALEIGGWIEKPRYDAAQHQLIWSLAAHNVGETSSPQDLVNYNTYALGREGYFSMTLITDRAEVDSLKPSAQQLLEGLNYTEGNRYSDFNPSTDRVATYGIAALVGGGLAAKKLGLFALIAAFFAKFFKVIVIAIIAAGAAIRSYLNKKS